MHLLPHSYEGKFLSRTVTWRFSQLFGSVNEYTNDQLFSPGYANARSASRYLRFEVVVDGEKENIG